MQSLFLGFAVLACPLGMGLMMWMMMRGNSSDSGAAQSQSAQQIEQLRAEIEQLKAERATGRAAGGQ